MINVFGKSVATLMAAASLGTIALPVVANADTTSTNAQGQTVTVLGGQSDTWNGIDVNNPVFTSQANETTTTYAAALNEMKTQYPDLYATLTPDQIAQILRADELRSRYSDAYMERLTGYTWRNGRMTPTASEIAHHLGDAFINSVHSFHD